MAGKPAAALGVRSLPARSNRHALIIGISCYADPGTPSLPGARIDRQSATQMASAMQVPASNMTYLQDEQATGNNIHAAVRELSDKVQDGDRLFHPLLGQRYPLHRPGSGRLRCGLARP